MEAEAKAKADQEAQLKAEAEAKATAEAAAKALGCRPREVFLASTGVIGEPLSHERILKAMDGLKTALKPAGWAAAAPASAAV